ncbi:MAG: hypothetical protein FJ405_14475 [Verrucomicrobia bacterium]|nr:hypothetical protein [Verrucomicrobiota bacterium]
MNNNNFAIMRYFRDLGADAHLLLLTTDGSGPNSHFTPENDTWDIDRWKPYIHRLDFGNTLASVVGDPIRLKLPPSAGRLRRAFEGFDVLVGSGITPIILSRCGRVLDIFYPYATGIEFVGCRSDQFLFDDGNLLRRALCRRFRKIQIEGIRKARHCVNAEMGLTRETFRSIGRECVVLATPLLYNREHAEEARPSEMLLAAKERLGRSRFTCFSHASQSWVHDPGKYPRIEWEKQSSSSASGTSSLHGELA